MMGPQGPPSNAVPPPGGPGGEIPTLTNAQQPLPMTGFSQAQPMAQGGYRGPVMPSQGQAINRKFRLSPTNLPKISNTAAYSQYRIRYSTNSRSHRWSGTTAIPWRSPRLSPTAKPARLPIRLQSAKSSRELPRSPRFRLHTRPTKPIRSAKRSPARWLPHFRSTSWLRTANNREQLRPATRWLPTSRWRAATSWLRSPATVPTRLSPRECFPAILSPEQSTAATRSGLRWSESSPKLSIPVSSASPKRLQR